MCASSRSTGVLPLSGVIGPLYGPTAAAPACPPKAAAGGVERAVVGSKRQRERVITHFHWERKLEQDLKPNILMVAGGGKTTQNKMSLSFPCLSGNTSKGMKCAISR